MVIKKTSEYFPAYAYVHRVCALCVCLVSAEIVYAEMCMPGVS